ncbi:transcription termination factor Rho [Homoserinimonas sp. OAct 916]|uniref:transcription termination factor Rho n=1 Tax=Homoserinimonas sp. OAct 916 TaxID=2211450 RepID=UPI000DBE7701|nr:transcription termination factor Rho [Homoserinimonas sp. OAct 916]
MTNVNNPNTDAASGGDLNTLKVTELQAMAAKLGVPGVSKLRKSALIEAISAGRAPASQKTAPAAEPVVEPVAARTSAGRKKSADAAEPAGRKAPAGAVEPLEIPEAPARRAPRRATSADALAALDQALDQTTARQSPNRRGAADSTSQKTEAEQAADEHEATEAGQQRGGRRGSRNEGNDRRKGARAQSEEQDTQSQDRKDGQGRTADTEKTADQDRTDHNGTAHDTGQDAGNGQGDDDKQASSGDRQQRNRRGRSDRRGSGQDADRGSDRTETKQEQGQKQGQNQNQPPNRGDDDGDQSRSGRSRYRDRKRRGGGQDDFEPEISDDDVLIPVAGILDVLDNYAFVRTSGYLPGTHDVYVSLGQVKKYHLRKGDAVVGAIRQPRDGESTGGRQKYNAIVKVDSINGLSVDEAATRVEFQSLTPLYPQERLRLETDASKVTTRIIDLVSPIGKGQRGLIVAPPKAGKTIVMQQIANAISANNPEVHLMVVLVDERPEEVTDMQRTVKGEVIASTFDRPAEDHTTVAELAIERAKRLVELGHDVVVLLDSITRLGRAYNLTAPASGRILSGGVDASALYPPKRFFGAARNIENGGSLTIIASALVETGSKMDEVIFEEFKGTGNMELRLSRQLADKRIFPAVDVNASGTRREEMLMSADETQVTWKLRRALAGQDTQQALEMVLGRLKETSSNVEFLMQVQKSMPTIPNSKEA